MTARESRIYTRPPGLNIRSISSMMVDMLHLISSTKKRPLACKKSYVLGYVSNGSHLSCITPRSPRSYITGKVFSPLTGTTLRTQQSNLCSISAAANLLEEKLKRHSLKLISHQRNYD
nr:hypothetical protein Iba_chr05aCG14680 [Ipomoea batatas]GMC98288.1 hypothetical protein Iba_chr05dCG15160 [Ipomoea batatas]GMD00493.1 hypothetical protein Iba_chr05eCG15770 [Ipomoea batatas]GMD02036.1 hypothetical protein Iba_chr05fCG12790 [Ipomoea batatas]